MSVTHGRRSTYDRHGCRCELCGAAQRAYRQALRARRRRETRPIVVVHGSASTYAHHRCRCDACRLAKNAAARDLRARRRAPSRSSSSASARPVECPFPLEPLLEAIVGQEGRRLVFAVEVLAHHVGVSVRTVWRRLHQGLDEKRADRWATRLGLHPGEVWPEWWYPESA